MHLVKWIRKNERKLMAFVVIFIMLSFVGGTALQQILTRWGSGANKPVAYMGQKGRISAKELQITAPQELNVLRMLGASEFLLSRGSVFGTPDFNSLLLGQLLFPNAQTASMMSSAMKQAVMRGQYQASNEDIDNFFKEASGRSEIFWLMLKYESKQAGCIIPADKAKAALRNIIPNIRQGSDAKQLVDYIVKTQRITEERIIQIFSDFLGVWTYAQMITNCEDITANQLKASFGFREERLSSEFAVIKAETLVEQQPEPNEQELIEQFEKYKNIKPDQLSKENPYGFGYMLPDRVQMEYLVFKLDDIRKQIPEPSQEEMEEYYRTNIEDFQYEESVDPNNPDSEKITRQKSFAEVVRQIKQKLTTEKTNIQSELVYNDAQDMLKANLKDVDIETISTEELKAHSGSYEQAAKQLSEKYKIKVYTGKTGTLSRFDIANDMVLRSLSMEGQDRSNVNLHKIVFAIEELGTTKLSRFEVPVPKMWENTGPFKDGYSMVAMIRIIGAEKASAPAGLDTSYSINGINLDNEQKDKVFSVKEKVTKDVKTINAMAVAKERAEELVKLANEKGWEEGIKAFNETYAEKDKEIKSDNWSNRTRSSVDDLLNAKLRTADNPKLADYLKTQIANKQLIDEVISILEPGQEEADNIQKILESKGLASYYVINNIKLTPATRQGYQQTKAQTAYYFDSIRASSVGLDHYKPSNIIKRTGFRWAGSEESRPVIQEEPIEPLEMEE